MLRERLQGDSGDVVRLLGRCREAGLDQALVIATCDRCEVWCTTSEPNSTVDSLVPLLAEAADLSAPDLIPQLHRLENAAAYRYAFAVAASLESQIVGEPQVLGQIKELHQLAQRVGMSGPELDRIMDVAYQTAKRVRNETGIAGQSVSMASCVLSVLKQMHGDLGSLSALLVGDGDMAQLIHEQVSVAGVHRWTMIHMMDRRAESWAARNQSHWLPMEKLPEALQASDLVVTALDAGRHVLVPAAVETALRKRKRRPILFVDAAVPGDIDPEVNKIDDAFLYALEDLERLAMAGRQHRSDAAEAARQIVEQCVAAFERQLEVTSVAPLIDELRRSFERQRAEILNQPGLDAAEATRRLVNRLLHRPTMELKAAVPARDLEIALRRLFGLNGKD